MSASERSFTIVNRLGLHARAAAKLVQVANHYQSEISVSREGHSANAKSIMGVLMLAAAQGSVVRIRVDGPDGAEAMDAIGALIQSGFGEDEGK